MAARFPGSGSLTCSIGGLDGVTPAAFTVAVLIKRNVAGAWQSIVSAEEADQTDSSLFMLMQPNDRLMSGRSGVSYETDVADSDTSNWHIFAATCAGVGSIPRFHLQQQGGGWTHDPEATSATWDDWIALTGTSEITIGEIEGADDLSADITYVGILAANSSDGTIETLGFTGPTAWDAIFTGADAWAIGFENVSSQTDRTGGGGNEASRSASLSLVSDPAGWSWGGGTTYDKDEIAISPFTGSGSRARTLDRTGLGRIGP